MPVQMRIQGLDKVQAVMARFPAQIKAAIQLSGKDMAKNILDTKGLRNYPPGTAANQPPGTSGRGYYIRGRGWMSKSGDGYTLKATSERLGTKWYVKPNGYSTLVGNPVTYAPYLHGDEQARWSLQIGWKKLVDVANDKIGESVRIYENHIQALIRRLGL